MNLDGCDAAPVVGELAAGVVVCGPRVLPHLVSDTAGERSPRLDEPLRVLIHPAEEPPKGGAVRIGKRQRPSVPGAIGRGQELATHPAPQPDQEHDEERGGVDGAVIRPPPAARGGELASDRIVRGVPQLVRDAPGLLLAAGFVPDPLRCRETQERHSAQDRERPLESESDSQRVAGEHRLEEP